MLLLAIFLVLFFTVVPLFFTTFFQYPWGQNFGTFGDTTSVTVFEAPFTGSMT